MKNAVSANLAQTTRVPLSYPCVCRLETYNSAFGAARFSSFLEGAVRGGSLRYAPWFAYYLLTEVVTSTIRARSEVFENNSRR